MSNTPFLPKWATDASYPAGPDPWSSLQNKNPPPGALVATGHVPGEEAPADYENHLKNAICENLRETAGAARLHMSPAFESPFGSMRFSAAAFDPKRKTTYLLSPNTNELLRFNGSHFSFYTDTLGAFDLGTAINRSTANSWRAACDAESGRVLLPDGHVFDPVSQLFESPNSYPVSLSGGGNMLYDPYNKRFISLGFGLGPPFPYTIYYQNRNPIGFWTGATYPPAFSAATSWVAAVNKFGLTVAFPNAYTGTDPAPKYLTSTDGGANWTSQAVGPSLGAVTGYLSHPDWCEARQEWMVCTSDTLNNIVRVYTSSSALSNTWVLRATLNNTESGVRSVYAFGHYWVALAERTTDLYSGAELWISSDGGDTWYAGAQGPLNDISQAPGFVANSDLTPSFFEAVKIDDRRLAVFQLHRAGAGSVSRISISSLIGQGEALS